MRFERVKLVSYLVIALGLAVGVWGFFSLKNVQTQYSVRQFLPDRHPSYEIDDKVQAQFQLAERPAFFAVVRLKAEGTFLEKDRAARLRAATESILKLEGVRRAVSIASVEGAFDSGNEISIGNLMENTAPEKWNERLLNDPLLSPALITKDARTTSVIVEINDMSLDQMKLIQGTMRTTLKEALPEAEVEIGGAPAIQGDLSTLLNKELGLFILLSALVCAITILVIFKNFSAVIIPFGLNTICNLAVMGWMAQVQIPFTVMSSTVPIMIFVTVITMCTHLMLRVDEEIRSKPKMSMLRIVFRANRELFVPNFLGPLTTLLGFVTLLLTDVPLMRQYGWTVIGAVSIAWSLTQILVIPMLILFPAPKPRAWTQKKADWLFPILRRHKKIVVGVTVSCILLFFAGSGLQWTALVFDDLPKNHEARRSTETIDKELGGAIPLNIVVSGKESEYWNEPSRLEKLDQLTKEFRTIKEVGSVVTLSDYVKSANLQSGELPKTRQAAAEIYFLYTMGETNPLANFLTGDGRATRISLRVKDIPANELKALTASIKAKTEKVFPQEKVQAAGMATTVHEINNALSAGLIFDFWQALLITSVALIIVFRSWRWALVAVLPNVVPPIALLGFLGLTGTPIKPIVAMIFSVVLGLAFGNTVYMINRLRGMQKQLNGYLPSKRAFHLEGNPCMISTLIVASGFCVFLFSDFSINRTFGAYVLISVAAGVVGDVMYLPSFLKWYPGFVKMKKGSRENNALIAEINEEAEKQNLENAA